jgi:hypothetical protein
MVAALLARRCGEPAPRIHALDCVDQTLPQRLGVTNASREMGRQQPARQSMIVKPAEVVEVIERILDRFDKFKRRFAGDSLE